MKKLFTSILLLISISVAFAQNIEFSLVVGVITTPPTAITSVWY